MLWAAERVGRRDRDLDRLHLGDAVTIGAAQALALFPGTSRSGVTIAMGLFRGLTRESSARFAFLMGIPVIAGATLWKMRNLVTDPPTGDQFGVLIVGMLSAALFGLLAISFLLRYLRTHDLSIFIVYRLVFAAVVTVLLLIR